MRDYNKLRKLMLKEAKKREKEIVWDDLYIDEVNRVIYDFTSNFDLSYDVDYMESSSDNWLQKTTRVPNMIGDRWYNVILDIDFRWHYDSAEDFVDKLIDAEKSTVEFLSHFQK